jgi:hypothetical protein
MGRSPARDSRRRGVRLLLLAALLCCPLVAHARVTHIEIDRVESPTFGGTEFGTVGAYEKLVGRAIGEVDPGALPDQRIADIGNAPRSEGGRVAYAIDFVLLRPLDPARGNRRLFHELANRGAILSLASLNQAPLNNDPTTAADAGQGFLMRQGYTILFSGWDATVPAGAGRLLLDVPVALQPNGAPIDGPALEEFVIDNAVTAQVSLTYPASSTDSALATLTKRRRQADERQLILSTDYEFVNASTIRLLPAGTPFEQGQLYELSYRARDPRVAGLGFSAVRDLTAFLKSGQPDDAGRVNPTPGLEKAYGFGISQPARFLRDFVTLGFNEGSGRRPVFDGILNFIAGPSGGFFNFRFAQPARTHRQRIGREYPEREFPFSYGVTFDRVTGRLDGRAARCTRTGTCPKILEANSANEYWVKGNSLLTTDTRGRDLAEIDGVRNYLFAGFPHQAATGNGICQQPRNPLGGGLGLRALLVALDAWVTSGTEPPPSRVPQRRDGTLVPSLPQRVQGFPVIPGVTYNGLNTTGDLLLFGSRLDTGILRILPPVALRRVYPVFVPLTDADGNERGGIRFPDVEVPLATFTGWALRAPEFGGDDLCDQFGQRLPFARTLAERTASGDPRLSLQERYTSQDDYVSKVEAAATALQRQRLLLDEDVRRLVDAARIADIGR